MIAADELKRVPIFACLTDAQRVRFAQTAAELNVQDGEWLIREGEAPWFFILLEGALDVEKEYGGRSEVRSRYQPGDFFGEIPILLDSPAIASLRASVPSRVMRLDRMQFKELIDSSPECSSLIVHVMAKRVSMIREYVQDNNPVRVLVLGSQYDDSCRDIRSFLSLNRISYRWADRDREPDQIPECVSPDMSGLSVVIDKSTCALLSAAAAWCVWSCFLYADWPMRWLMKPAVKWTLYSAAALVFVGAFCAGKGWL